MTSRSHPGRYQGVTRDDIKESPGETSRSHPGRHQGVTRGDIKESSGETSRSHPERHQGVTRDDIKESSGETSRSHPERHQGVTQGDIKAAFRYASRLGNRLHNGRHPKSMRGGMLPESLRKPFPRKEEAGRCAPVSASAPCFRKKKRGKEKKIARLFANRELILIFVGKEIPIKQLST